MSDDVKGMATCPDCGVSTVSSPEDDPVNLRVERDEALAEVERLWEEVAFKRGQLRAARHLAEKADRYREALEAFFADVDTHEPGPFVKDGNWHPGPCVEGGPRMEDVYPEGFQVCADEDCRLYWPCPVEELRRATLAQEDNSE